MLNQVVLLNNRWGLSNDGITWFAEIRCLEKGVLKLSMVAVKMANRKQCITYKNYIVGASVPSKRAVTDQNLYWLSVQSVKALVHCMVVHSYNRIKKCSTGKNFVRILCLSQKWGCFYQTLHTWPQSHCPKFYNPLILHAKKIMAPSIFGTPSEENDSLLRLLCTYIYLSLSQNNPICQLQNRGLHSVMPLQAQKASKREPWPKEYWGNGSWIGSIT